MLASDTIVFEKGEVERNNSRRQFLSATIFLFLDFGIKYVLLVFEHLQLLYFMRRCCFIAFRYFALRNVSEGDECVVGAFVLGEWEL